MISVQHLTKSFGSTVALKDISFSVQKGEIIGLLGPNGAGKTTMMRILAGVLEPDNGEVYFDGKDVLEHKSIVKERLGYLAENNPLYDDMLVSEYLEMIAALRSRQGSPKEAIAAAIEQTGIRSVFQRPIHELSKGFRQRVGLAQAMLNEPELLILDEPTEGLDPNQRVDIRSLIKNLGANKTVLISTHVLPEVMEMCNRLIIVDRGAIVADGPASELLNQAQKEHRLTVELSGEGIHRDALLSVDGVLSVVSQQSLQDRMRFDLTCDGTKPSAPAIFQLAKQRGWTLWELHQEKMNLEQLFRQLTQVS